MRRAMVISALSTHTHAFIHVLGWTVLPGLAQTLHMAFWPFHHASIMPSAYESVVDMNNASPLPTEMTDSHVLKRAKETYDPQNNNHLLPLLFSKDCIWTPSARQRYWKGWLILTCPGLYTTVPLRTSQPVLINKYHIAGG